jgi:hypothetical protein
MAEGPRKIHGHRTGPYSPYKIPKHRSCKSSDRSGLCKMRDVQKSGPCKIPEQRS